jgi:hypothetical protein
MGDRDLVADAAATLTACMEAAESLIGARDQTGLSKITTGSTESSPPWNEAVAAALTTVWAGVRQLENQLRGDHGLRPLCRGGSDRNTREAIAAIVKMCTGMSEEHAAWYARRLDRWSAPMLALPAVDRLPQWSVISMPSGGNPPDCPYCHRPALRAHETHGVVVCLYPRCPSASGQRSFARIGWENGAKMWRWLDGRVQP